MPLATGAATATGADWPAAAARTPSDNMARGDHSVADGLEEVVDVDERSEVKMLENMERASCGVGKMGS